MRCSLCCILLAAMALGCGGDAATGPKEIDCTREIAAHLQQWGSIPYTRTDAPGKVTFVHTSTDYVQTFVFTWGAGIDGCQVSETSDPR